jgi:hypothetical protein
LPTQPNINKGTLILLAPNATEAAVSSKNIYFSFQYNPEKLLHTFNPPEKNTESQCPALEYFNLTFDLDSIEIDASPQTQTPTQFGLHPALAMLESMMQPQEGGSQTTLPIAVFKWGEKRLVPVSVVSMTVEEKSFDLILNPTRAAVSLTLKVLNTAEVNSNQAARKVLQTHQNDRKSLVETYKSQTGQAPASNVSTAAAAANASISKTKISA